MSNLEAKAIVQKNKKEQQTLTQKQQILAHQQKELKEALQANEAYHKGAEYQTALARYNDIEHLIDRTLRLREQERGRAFTGKEKQTIRQELETHYYSAPDAPDRLKIKELLTETGEKLLAKLETKLFREENFTLPKDRETKLNATKKYKKDKNYYINKKLGKFYCSSKALLEELIGRENLKAMTIDRYNRSVLKFNDTDSPLLDPTCSDEQLLEAFQDAKAYKQWIKDPSVKQKFDEANCPTGVVDWNGELRYTDHSYLRLWSPENGEIFNIYSDADTWRPIHRNDNNDAYPFLIPAEDSF